MCIAIARLMYGRVVRIARAVARRSAAEEELCVLAWGAQREAARQTNCAAARGALVIVYDSDAGVAPVAVCQLWPLTSCESSSGVGCVQSVQSSFCQLPS